jgi:SPP1 gp7 family putative phage head morphogenesis protein
MSAHYMSDENFALVKATASQNLAAWKKSGVVKTLKCYSAEDDDVCATCRQRHGSIVQIEEAVIGVNIPKFGDCARAQCRCYFRPWDISTE